jgi:hypothetical protein
MGAQENSIVMRMGFLGITRAQLSVLTDIREQVLIPGLKCTRPLSNQDTLRIVDVLTRLEELAERARPFALPTDTRKLQFLLQKQKLGDLDEFPVARARSIADEMDTVR